MRKIRIRPRYTFTTNLSKSQVLSKLREGLDNTNALRGKFVKPLVVISLIEENQHFWSPELSLDLEEKKGVTEIRCTLGPRPSIWTMFATFYGFSILVGVAGLVLGFSQLSLGMNTTGFWLVPASIILITVAYIIAIIGQRMAYDQMLELRSFIKAVLKDNN
ncbi:MAG: hypothetical protein AAF462_02775 [Thermodesulfobacteriota bacterium]